MKLLDRYLRRVLRQFLVDRYRIYCNRNQQKLFQLLWNRPWWWEDWWISRIWKQETNECRKTHIHRQENKWDGSLWMVARNEWICGRKVIDEISYFYVNERNFLLLRFLSKENFFDEMICRGKEDIRMNKRSLIGGNRMILSTIRISFQFKRMKHRLFKVLFWKYFKCKFSNKERRFGWFHEWTNCCLADRDMRRILRYLFGRNSSFWQICISLISARV